MAMARSRSRKLGCGAVWKPLGGRMLWASPWKRQGKGRFRGLRRRDGLALVLLPGRRGAEGGRGPVVLPALGGEDDAGPPAVLVHRGDERVHAREIELGAEMVDKRHPQMLAVEIAREIEEMGLEQEGLAVEHRP